MISWISYSIIWLMNLYNFDSIVTIKYLQRIWNLNYLEYLTLFIHLLCNFLSLCCSRFLQTFDFIFWKILVLFWLCNYLIISRMLFSRLSGFYESGRITNSHWWHADLYTGFFKYFASRHVYWICSRYWHLTIMVILVFWKFNLSWF